MTQDTTLTATPRAGTGKGAARSLRREGRIPAVIYGHGRPAQALTIDSTTLDRLLAGGAAATTVLSVEVEGQAPVRALIREIQRNPVRPADILHLDLFEVRADEAIEVDVPVRLQGIPEGVRTGGGTLEQAMHSLTIRVLPGDLPAVIDLDVSGLAIGHSLHIRDLAVPKATILHDPSLPVATVVPPRAEPTPAAEAAATASAEPELIRKPKPDEDQAK